jgi:hypothetical protein
MDPTPKPLTLHLNLPQWGLMVLLFFIFVFFSRSMLQEFTVFQRLHQPPPLLEIQFISVF